MQYRNFLAIHSIQDTIESLSPAVSMARHYGAHLEILVLNLASPVPTMTFIQNPDFDWSDSYSQVLGESRQRIEQVQRWLEDKGISSEVSSSCQQLGLVDDDVMQPALYADIVLFHKGSESMVSGMMSKALDGAVFDAARPALILPSGHAEPPASFKRIAIAWDPTPGAMHAISAGLLLLASASYVELAIVSREYDKRYHQDQTLKIRQWLNRHDIKAELTVVHQEDRLVSEVLLDYVNSADLDLMVMGAYGHSRFTERLFSGVSHQLLDKSDKALLLAH
ncbi:MAG: universal stress protein [Granulosicoccus sp.]|nr:universal stress protein [Granulosicoccus sp.]